MLPRGTRVKILKADFTCKVDPVGWIGTVEGHRLWEGVFYAVRLPLSHGSSRTPTDVWYFKPEELDPRQE